MDTETIRNYALTLGEVTEGFPFGEDTLVFKVNNKMFLLVSLSATPVQFNAKCHPDKAIELRAAYNNILPGYHMNKKHWNTVILDGRLPQELVKELIYESFCLVVENKKQ
jgi:predicted DNA-binding protein (MmcQ/YjbR family)